jgi:CTP synthase (UTP-ammonia lyase)
MFNYLRKSDISMIGVIVAVSFVVLGMEAWAAQATPQNIQACIQEGYRMPQGGGKRNHACKMCCFKFQKQQGTPCLTTCDQRLPPQK